jgi:CrcB protein
MNAVVAVALGGALGSVSRYVVGALLARPGAALPWATLAVNVAGSFAIGVLLRTTAEGSVARLALATGFCGGFTTFSAFSAETVQLLQQGRLARAAAYALASVLLSVGAALAGYALGGRR